MLGEPTQERRGWQGGYSGGVRGAEDAVLLLALWGCQRMSGLGVPDMWCSDSMMLSLIHCPCRTKDQVEQPLLLGRAERELAGRWSKRKKSHTVDGVAQG